VQTIDKLKAAAEEGLAYLQSQPGVREAEVFVASNGALLTRLNYTSHIPSNGVEEPKSTESYGIGVRAVFANDGGPVRVGFGSETSDITQEGVRSALEKARKGAVEDAEFTTLPRPIAGAERTLVDYHDPRLMDLSDEDLVGAGWQVVNGALDTFDTSERLNTLAGGRAQIKKLGLIVGGDVTILQERIAIASSHFPTVQADESTLIMSFITSMVEKHESKGSGYATAARFAEFTDVAGVTAAKNAIDAIDGQRVKDGVYKVVFGKQPVTDLLNNLVLPSLNAGTFYAGGSAFNGKFGEQIASEILSVYDDGARRGLLGSKGITCEGLPTGRTDLIKNGVLAGVLSNFYETERLLSDPRAKEKLGVDPSEARAGLVPRNGFRFGLGGGRHFDMPPSIAATNVIIEGRDDRSLDDLLREVGDGLFIGRIWYTYPINGLVAGDFTCTVVGDSYLIKDGRLAAPLKPNTVRIDDNIKNILNNLLGVSRDRAGTLVWAADEITYAPEMAVANVHVREIASFMEEI
jgi:PmbA protein